MLITIGCGPQRYQVIRPLYVYYVSTHHHHRHHSSPSPDLHPVSESPHDTSKYLKETTQRLSHYNQTFQLKNKYLHVHTSLHVCNFSSPLEISAQGSFSIYLGYTIHVRINQLFRAVLIILQSSSSNYNNGCLQTTKIMIITCCYCDQTT